MKGYSIILALLLAYAIWVFSISINNFDYSGSSADFTSTIADFEPQKSSFKFVYSDFETSLLSNGLVDIATLHPDIIVQLAYATKNNFTQKILYQNLRRGFLQKAIAEKLISTQTYLYAIDTNYRLVILDATRPRSIQKDLWDWAVANDKKKYVAAPNLGSIHNFGCALDVTIMGKDSLLDMGTNYDHFGPEAEPRYNWDLFQKGILTKEQIDNRAVLREVMKKSGFRAIDTEWWHFNGLDKENARRYYKLIE